MNRKSSGRQQTLRKGNKSKKLPKKRTINVEKSFKTTNKRIKIGRNEAEVRKG
jgi:hypothetical protein